MDDEFIDDGDLDMIDQDDDNELYADADTSKFQSVAHSELPPFEGENGEVHAVGSDIDDKLPEEDSYDPDKAK